MAIVRSCDRCGGVYNPVTDPKPAGETPKRDYCKSCYPHWAEFKNAVSTLHDRIAQTFELELRELEGAWYELAPLESAHLPDREREKIVEDT